AFGTLMRVLYVALPGMRWDWRPMLWAVAILTILGGPTCPTPTTTIKRRPASSSSAPAGFILPGVIAVSKAGLSGSLFYLVAYGFMTIGAFAVVMLVRDASGEATPPRGGGAPVSDPRSSPASSRCSCSPWRGSR